MIESEDVGALVAAVKDNAQRLGLTWSLRFGTISTATTVLMDGADTETEPIPVISLIGPLTSGGRVAVMAVPPSGQYVIGVVGEVPHLIAEASSTASTAAIGAETVTLTSPLASYASGRCYEARMLGNWAASALNNQGIIRLRINGGGSIAVEQRTPLLPAFGSLVSATLFGQFRVALPTFYQFDETLTSTAGTIVDAASAAGTARRLQIWDIGPSSLFTNVRSV
jgi:hypothetical protein